MLEHNIHIDSEPSPTKPTPEKEGEINLLDLDLDLGTPIQNLESVNTNSKDNGLPANLDSVPVQKNKDDDDFLDLLQLDVADTNTGKENLLVQPNAGAEVLDVDLTPLPLRTSGKKKITLDDIDEFALLNIKGSSFV